MIIINITFEIHESHDDKLEEMFKIMLFINQSMLQTKLALN